MNVNLIFDDFLIFYQHKNLSSHQYDDIQRFNRRKNQINKQIQNKMAAKKKNNMDDMAKIMNIIDLINCDVDQSINQSIIFLSIDLSSFIAKNTTTIMDVDCLLLLYCITTNNKRSLYIRI